MMINMTIPRLFTHTVHQPQLQILKSKNKLFNIFPVTEKTKSDKDVSIRKHFDCFIVLILTAKYIKVTSLLVLTSTLFFGW